MGEVDPGRITADLAGLLHRKLGVGGADLQAGQQRAGRMLPRRLRRDLAFLSDQELMASHPRLAAQVDLVAVARAERRVRLWLARIDPAERRKDRALRTTAVVALNLLVLAGLIVAVLAWRGMIGPG
ncbi:MAG: hypothetical protein ACK5IB_03965 [Qingshengfaniella sp.]